MTDRSRYVRTRLGIEALEDRTTPTQFGNPWADPTHLTLSFAPDGTRVLGVPSSAQASLGHTMPAAVWQKAVLRAVQTWSEVANISVGLVADGGQVFGAAGPVQRDPRFGDIRVGGLPMGGEALAEAVPPDPFVSGTLAGDIFINTRKAFTFDKLYGVALHEVGHALGLAPSTDPQSVMFNTFNQNLVLSASDITAIQTLYGSRAADANEGAGGNETIATATQINPPGGFDGTTPLVAFGDITARTDVDVFRVTNLSGYAGPVTFRVQTSGISLLPARLTVTDVAGNVLGFAAGVGVRGGVLTVTLAHTVPGADYYVRVQAAPGQLFGVGRYGVGVTFDRLRAATAEPLGVVLRGQFDTLTSDELHDLFEHPDRTYYADDHGTDDDSPARMPEVGGFPEHTQYRITASLASATDVDQYRVRTPNTGTAAVLSAVAREVGPNGAVPRIQVFDKDLNPIPVRIITNGNGTFAIQATGLAPNQDYVVKLTDSTGPGNYALDVSFLTKVADVKAFSSDTLNAGATLKSTLYLGRSQVFGLALSATGPVGTGVQLSIVNDSGRTVFTLTATAGDTVTAPTPLLAPGHYRLRITATGPAGAVQFALAGNVITDPIGPRPVNSATAPQYQSPTDPNSFLYPDGTQTTDPFLFLPWFTV